jgi:hypothetical protein
MRSAHAHADELKVFEEFYREAELRDTAMAENLRRAIEKTGAQNVVLVTGGFHRFPGLESASFVPKISHVEVNGGSAYLSVFTQEKTPLEKLFDGDKLFLTPEVWTPVLQNEQSLLSTAAETRMNALGRLRFVRRLRGVSGAIVGIIAATKARVSLVWFKPSSGMLLRRVSFSGEKIDQVSDAPFPWTRALMWGIAACLVVVCPFVVLLGVSHEEAEEEIQESLAGVILKFKRMGAGTARLISTFAFRFGGFARGIENYMGFLWRLYKEPDKPHRVYFEETILNGTESERKSRYHDALVHLGGKHMGSAEVKSQLERNNLSLSDVPPDYVDFLSAYANYRGIRYLYLNRDKFAISEEGRLRLGYELIVLLNNLVVDWENFGKGPFFNLIGTPLARQVREDVRAFLREDDELSSWLKNFLQRSGYMTDTFDLDYVSEKDRDKLFGYLDVIFGGRPDVPWGGRTGRTSSSYLLKTTDGIWFLTPDAKDLRRLPGYLAFDPETRKILIPYDADELYVSLQELIDPRLFRANPRLRIRVTDGIHQEDPVIRTEKQILLSADYVRIISDLAARSQQSAQILLNLALTHEFGHIPAMMQSSVSMCAFIDELYMSCQEVLMLHIWPDKVYDRMVLLLQSMENEPERSKRQKKILKRLSTSLHTARTQERTIADVSAELLRRYPEFQNMAPMFLDAIGMIRDQELTSFSSLTQLSALRNDLHLTALTSHMFTNADGEMMEGLATAILQFGYDMTQTLYWDRLVALFRKTLPLNYQRVSHEMRQFTLFRFLELFSLNYNTPPPGEDFSMRYKAPLLLWWNILPGMVPGFIMAARGVWLGDLAAGPAVCVVLLGVLATYGAHELWHKAWGGRPRSSRQAVFFFMAAFSALPLLVVVHVVGFPSDIDFILKSIVVGINALSLVPVGAAGGVQKASIAKVWSVHHG